jgi:hypothetical protein
VPFDLFDGESVAGVDVETDCDVRRAHTKRFGEKASEESEHRDVRVHELDHIPIFGTVGPIEHATRQM